MRENKNIPPEIFDFFDTNPQDGRLSREEKELTERTWRSLERLAVGRTPRALLNLHYGGADIENLAMEDPARAKEVQRMAEKHMKLEGVPHKQLNYVKKAKAKSGGAAGEEL